MDIRLNALRLKVAAKKRCCQSRHGTGKRLLSAAFLPAPIASQFDVDKHHGYMYYHRMKKTNPSFLNGVPELLVLRLLARREMYGYQIVEEIRTQTGEALSFGEGCIYPYLHYLEAEKQVSSRRREVEGRNRNYYKLTARGRKRLEALTSEWKRVTTGVSLLMEEQYA